MVTETYKTIEVTKASLEMLLGVMVAEKVSRIKVKQLVGQTQAFRTTPLNDDGTDKY